MTEYNAGGWPVRMTDQECVEFNRKLKEDLDKWLSEVRHYPQEREIILSAAEVVEKYSHEPKY